MRKSLSDLLAMDTVARRHGCALKPKLREAIEKDLRFPVRASTSPLDQSIDPSNLPENVHPLQPHRDKPQGKSA